MSENVYAELIALCAGALLLTSVLMVWRHSLLASIRLLAAQGVTLAVLVAVIGIREANAELLVVFVLILALKGIALPWVLARSSAATGSSGEESPRLNPTAALMTVALLTTLAYVVSVPLVGTAKDLAAHAVPIGVAMVLIGFLLLVTRRRARSQLIGFLLLDNGIAAVAFLISGGVPVLLELGVSLDLLLVVVILHVFTGRMRNKFGETDVDRLSELRD
ncbi:MAG: hypothetical protein ACYCZY_10240 [Lacisediminihabitans sp.]